jgi:flagellar biogenesis protein FliO
MASALTLVKIGGVFLLLFLTLAYLRRSDVGRLRSAARTHRPVAVVGSARLGKSSVALVRIGAETYAVGVTDTRVSLLIPDPVALPDADADGTPAPVSAGTRPTFIDALRQQVAGLRRSTRPVPVAGLPGLAGLVETAPPAGGSDPADPAAPRSRPVPTPSRAVDGPTAPPTARTPTLHT